jgi:hypothetical protein
MSLVYRNQNVYPPTLMNEWIGAGSSQANIHCVPAETDISALVFWLGGFPNREGRFEGFSADPEAPFGRVDDSGSNPGAINTGWTGSVSPADSDKIRIGTPEKKVFLELEVNKNVFFFHTTARGMIAPCLGLQSGSTVLPIVYFRASSGGGTGAYYDYRSPPAHQPGVPGTPKIKSYNFGTNVTGEWQGCGVVVPYARSGEYADGTIVWHEPTKYQLIHPGLDGVFGLLGTPPTLERTITSGIGIGPWDSDNITNISDFKELRSILP